MENKANKEWQPTADRFVAVFDIMGFKDMVQRKESSDIFKRIKEIKNTLKQLEDKSIEDYDVMRKLKIEKQQTRSITFSDSIFVFSKGNTERDFYKIIIDSAITIRKSIACGFGITGALSYGEIIVDFDNNIFFGQPIIDAYFLREELLLYSTVLDNNIEVQLKKMKEISLLKKFITHYPTPFKSGIIQHKLAIACSPEILEDTYPDLENLYNTVSGKPRLYIDNTIGLLNYIKEKNKKQTYQ